MNTLRDILIVATFCAGCVAFIAHMGAQLDRYNESEAGRCYQAHVDANYAHISFRSVDHGVAWCEDHKDTWRDKVNGRILEAAERIDARRAAER